jgi:Family of unknown function (DUF6152)
MHSRSSKSPRISFAIALFLTLPAAAHHSFRAQYDSNQPITVTGIVTKVDWMNPHVYFYIDVKNDSGAVDNWGFEMGPPHMLQQRGWKRNSMQIGDEVTVEGSRARDGSHNANARRVTLTATGEVLGAASSEGQTISSGPRAQ